jgi:AbrB family looped-hinge helix DNA binding protein
VAATAKRLTTVISTKGQVILPKAIRDQRHWSAGMRLTVESTAEGVLLKPAPLFEVTTVDAMFGSLGGDGPVRSVEDLAAAVAAEAKRRARD